MIDILLLFVPLALQLAAIYVLSGYANSVLFRRLGKTLYLLIMWPGVMVHELSHLLACLVTFTKVFEVKLFAPHEESPGTLVLGYVRHAQPGNPVSAALIGGAPFFGGAAALWVAMRLLFPSANAVFTALSATNGQDLAALGLRLAGQYAAFFASLAQALDWRSWTTYVFFYLVLVLSSHIAPSRPDMLHALSGVIGIIVLVGVFVAIGRWLGFAMQAGLIAAGSQYVGSVTVLLSYGLAFTFLMAVIAAAIQGVAALSKR